MRKTTGNICVVAIDAGNALAEKISPFDTFIHMIKGVAKVVNKNQPSLRHTGESIIIPAHTSDMVKANGRFKMIFNSK